MNRTQTMVQDIKNQILAELEHNQSYSASTHAGGLQAYRQLVDAVREEVLYDLNIQANSSPVSTNQELVKAIKDDVLYQLQGTHGNNAIQNTKLSPQEMNMIKQEILMELQMEKEEQEGRP